MKITINAALLDGVSELVKKKHESGESVTVENWIESAIHEKAIRDENVGFAKKHPTILSSPKHSGSKGYTK